MSTSTMEKLFAEIFIRKDQIIEQVQQQADSYTNQLASKFLINGVTPPPWLLSPNFYSQSSNPNQLKKEEIISKLLLPPRHDSVSYSRDNCPLYYRPVVAGGNGQISSATCMENDALNKGVEISNGSMTMNDCHDNDIVCTAKVAAELDNSGISPQNETEARISSIYAAPDSSLARIQRSKSRQKARELRTNGKIAVKSGLSNENRNHISFSGDPISKSDFLQVIQDKCPSEVGKCNDISGETYMSAEGKGFKGNDRTSHSGRVTNCSSSYEKPFLIDHSKNSSSSEKKELVSGVLVQPSGSSLQQYDHVNSIMDGGKLLDVSLGSYTCKKSISEKTQDTQSQNKLFCGIITRSRSSRQQISGINRSLKLYTLTSCNPKEDGGELSKSVGNSMHGLIASNKLPDSVETSQVLSDRIDESEALCSNEDVLNPVISSNTCQVSRTRSGSMKESSLGANHKENAEIVENMPTEAPAELQAINSGNRVDPATLCTEPEGLVLRQSPDCCMIFKPKQLNFDENDEYDLNEIVNSLSKKRKLDGLSGTEHYTSKESTSLIDSKCGSTFCEQQLPKENVRSNSLKATKTHSHKKIDECAKDETMNIVSDVTESPMLEEDEQNLKISQHDDIDVTCEINIFPKEVNNIFDEEMCPRISHLYGDHESLSKKKIKEGDLSHREEESATAVYRPISKNNSRLTKQANKDTKEDLGSLQSGELEIGMNPKLSDVKLSSAQADLGHKDEEKAADVYDSIYKNSKSSFLSSLSKQENNDSEQDLGSLKSDQHEIETNQKVSNVKLSSDKVNMWPCNQERNVEEHPNCFSDSQNFRVHIHRDAIHCDLEASGNGVHSAKESASILPSEETYVTQSDDMMCDWPERGKSLLELQAAEAVVTEVDDDVTEICTLKQSEPICVSNLIKNSADDNTYSMAADVRPTNPIINPEQDLGSSKSNKSEIETNQKVSNVKLSSVKVDSWPCKRQRNVEEHPTSFFDSQNFMVHIHRDAVHCDLEASGNGVHSAKESASILPSEETYVAQSDDMMCDCPERRESLLELQATEAVVTEVDDDITEISDTLKQYEPICVSNLIKNSADDNTCSLAVDVGPTNPIIDDDIADAHNNNNSFEISLPEWVSSCDSVRSSRNDHKADEILPVYEGFIIDEEVENASIENAEGGIDFDTLEISNTTITRASILEQICKSASMQTPLSEFSSKFKQHQLQDYYGFMSDGILERMDLGTTVDIPASYSDITETDFVFPFQQRFDYATPFYWESKNHYSSPVGKLWERSTSSSGSSEKKLSSNPELTCFPIEEDPYSDEESENAEEMSDELQENVTSKVENENSSSISTEMKIDEVVAERESPPESTEVCSQHVNHESNITKHQDRYSSSSIHVEVSVPRTRDKVKYTPRIHRGLKISRYNQNRNSSMATRASSRGNLSEFSKNKSSMRSGITRLSQKEAKHNNIVSNISSFIPMVQLKQAAAVCPVKRDIKVKALEAAEAAKRRAQEKENERKMKKEALKLERARIGKENAREMELNKKKKQEELKKKEADVAARKRQREEEEKKQAAKKRKLIAEAHKNQKLQYEKSRAGKAESEKHVKNATIAGSKKGSENPRQNKNAVKNSLQRQDSDSSVVRQFTSVLENHDASSNSSEKEKATNEKSPVKVVPVMLTSHESSYDISPYQCSDDEGDEEDDLPKKSNKFIPSWASVNSVAMVLTLQQNLDPETIFPLDRSCNPNEVLLPRKLQAK